MESSITVWSKWVFRRSTNVTFKPFQCGGMIPNGNAYTIMVMHIHNNFFKGIQQRVQNIQVSFCVCAQPMLQCNIISHWQGACTKWSLNIVWCWNTWNNAEGWKDCISNGVTPRFVLMYWNGNHLWMIYQFTRWSGSIKHVILVATRRTTNLVPYHLVISVPLIWRSGTTGSRLHQDDMVPG